MSTLDSPAVEWLRSAATLQRATAKGEKVHQRGGMVVHGRHATAHYLIESLGARL